MEEEKRDEVIEETVTEPEVNHVPSPEEIPVSHALNEDRDGELGAIKEMLKTLDEKIEKINQYMYEGFRDTTNMQYKTRAEEDREFFNNL